MTPEFHSDYNSNDIITLVLKKDVIRMVCHFSSDGYLRDMHFDLSKQDAIRLIAELTSWLDTGKCIQPEHEYVAVIEDIKAHHDDKLRIRKVKAKDKEAAEIKAVGDYVQNPNFARLIGVLEMPEEK